MDSKILEEQIREYGVKLGSPPSSDQELLSLLEETENVLTVMDQFPSPTLLSALQLMATALATKGIMMHPSDDVRVAVTLCICEVVRITTPDAPYDDDLMREVFVKIVESFTRLDDIESRSFVKRISILETVAKVKCFILMLDLECDDLVLEMFRHFLHRISLDNEAKVSKYMETIMSIVIEESEEIPQDLLSCLLWSVRKERMASMLASFRLGEKVISNCAEKLRPLLKVMKGNNVKDYSEVVTSLCEEASTKNTMAEQGAIVTPQVAQSTETPVVEVTPTLKINRPSRTIKRTQKVVEAETMELEFIMSIKRKRPGKQTQPSDLDEDASQEISIKDAGKKTTRKALASESSGLKKKRHLEKLKEKAKDHTTAKTEDKTSCGMKHTKNDESIVGERIKVWRPRDKAFYNATVKEYNYAEKRHIVTYDDGDIEVLCLNKEVWELLDQESQDTPATESSVRAKQKENLLDGLKETPKKPRCATKSKVKEPMQISKPGIDEEKCK